MEARDAAGPPTAPRTEPPPPRTVRPDCPSAKVRTPCCVFFLSFSDQRLAVAPGRLAFPPARKDLQVRPPCGLLPLAHSWKWLPGPVLSRRLHSLLPLPLGLCLLLRHLFENLGASCVPGTVLGALGAGDAAMRGEGHILVFRDLTLLSSPNMHN